MTKTPEVTPKAESHIISALSLLDCQFKKLYYALELTPLTQFSLSFVY